MNSVTTLLSIVYTCFALWVTFSLGREAYRAAREKEVSWAIFFVLATVAFAWFATGIFVNLVP